MRSVARGMAVCGAVLAALSGCASSLYEGKYAWDDGWREGKIIQIGAASELGGRHSTDCRYAATRNAGVADRYAVVSYRNVGRERRAVVPIATQALRPGDLILANVKECSASTVMRRGDRDTGTAPRSKAVDRVSVQVVSG